MASRMMMRAGDTPETGSHLMLKLEDVCSYDVGSYGRPLSVAFTHDAMFRVGKYCSIGGEVKIILSAEHRPDWITTYPFNIKWNKQCDVTGIEGHPSTKGDIILENDVWIGWGAMLLSGITIHSGAVVAAGAVVTKDVEHYTIVGGNPARPLKKRFSDETINKLLEVQWWNWPTDKIKDNVHLLCSNNIEEFLDGLR